MTDTTQSGSSSTGRRVVQGEGPTSRWTGWILFAATMMVLLGAFHAIQGLLALFQEDYYLVKANGLTVHASYAVWGWTHLILGIVVAAAGWALVSGKTWARVVGTIAAMVSAIVNIGFLAASPVWSGLMVALDVIVIWAITVHGAEMKSF